MAHEFKMKSDIEVVVTVLYPKKGMSNFDMNYYLKHYFPSTEAAQNALGMSSCMICNVEEKAEYAVNVLLF